MVVCLVVATHTAASTAPVPTAHRYHSSSSNASPSRPGNTSVDPATGEYIGQLRRFPGASSLVPPAGTPDRPDNPELAMWVFGTLVWTAVHVVEQLLRPLPAHDGDASYRDMQKCGRLFGVTPDQLPTDFAALDDCVQAMSRTVLAVDFRALRPADRIVEPQPPLLPARRRRTSTDQDIVRALRR